MPGRRITHAPTTAVDAALRRVRAEILDGLCHGYFEFTLTSEVIGQRKRLILRAGKNYQFVIPAYECERQVGVEEGCDVGGDHNELADPFSISSRRLRKANRRHAGVSITARVWPAPLFVNREETVLPTRPDDARPILTHRRRGTNQVLQR